MSQTDRAAIPILSNLPIIGNFFKSKADSKERTELVVLITPHLVRPIEAGHEPPLPTRPDQFLRPGRPGGPDAPGGAGSDDGGQVEKKSLEAQPLATDKTAVAPAPAPKLCVLVWCRE